VVTGSERWTDPLRVRNMALGLLLSGLGMALATLTGVAMVMARALLFVPLAAVALVYALTLPAVAALSRAREFAADRDAAILTGAPAVLAAALLKLADEIERLPAGDLRAAALMNSLLVLPVGPVPGVLGRLAATHPPVPARVERLVAMQATLEERPLLTISATRLSVSAAARR